MKIKQNIINHIQKRPLGKRIIEEHRYRVIRTASVGFGVNLLYAFYHGVIGVINLSLWFITMCGYYTILGIMRFSAVICDRRSGAEAIRTEYFLMRLIGVLLLILSLLLSGVIYISLAQKIAIAHDEILMITIATYTFYKITLAIIHAVKRGKDPSPLLAAIRNIGYAEVAVSILTLQQSMLASFGSMPESQARIMNILTGAVVCIFVFCLGVAMIISKNKKERIKQMVKDKIIQTNEKIANKLTGAMEKIEDTVVGGYNKVEDAVVGRYNKIEDAFVGRYLTHEGESVAEAKQRLQKQHSNTIEDSEQKAKDAGNCACEDVSAAEEEKE